MIRIDLLPDYVAKRRLTFQLIFVFAVLFAAITCSLLVFNYAVLVPQALAKEAEATTDEGIQTEINGYNGQASTTLAEIQPIKDKLQFVQDVEDYNRSWVALYDQLARYTDPKLVYASAAVSGASMTINAYSPNIDEVGRYLERMYEEPDFSTVTIDHLPDYPESVINKYYLNGKLIAVGELPGLNDARPGQAGGGLSGGQSGMRSAGGGYPGSQTSYGGQSGGMSGQYGGGRPGGMNGQIGGGGGQTGLSSNGEPTFGTVINPLTAQEIPTATLDEFIDQAVDPIAAGDQEARLRDVVRARLLRQVVVKHQIRGFQIVVTALLKKPFVPPAIPASSGGPAAGATTPGQFGGPGGGLGMPPGMQGSPSGGNPMMQHGPPAGVAPGAPAG